MVPPGNRFKQILLALSLTVAVLLAVTVAVSVLREKKEELVLMSRGILTVEGKSEVVGNLIAGRLKGGGVGSFSFGEYFEAESLIEIEAPKPKVKRLLWVDGVAYTTIEAGRVELEEKLIAYGDTLVYLVSNPSRSKVKLRFSGEIEVFNWFKPDFRSEIAKLANVSFEYSGGYLKAVYQEAYHLCLASTIGLTVEIGSDKASYRVEAELNPGEKFTFAVAGAGSTSEAKRRVDEALADPSKLEDAKRREVRKLLESIPSLTGVKPEYDKLWKYMWYTIFSDRAYVWSHPILENPFTMPSKFGLRHQWLWDSAFHAVVLAEYDVRMAEEELLNLFKAQKPDGRIPHEIFLSREFCKLFWGVDDYSPWTTQPPVLAIAVKRIADRGGSEDFLRKAFKVLDKYDRWFREARDYDKDQLMAYVDYLESGWDNSVRWDKPIELFEKNREYYKKRYSDIRMAAVEAVDLNCLIYLQRRILSELAEKIGLEDAAEEYRRLAEETAEGVRRYMWDPETGFYYDVLEENHAKIMVKTPAAFLTMYSGIATEGQAGKLVEHLLNPREFWTRFPLPSVSADNPRYDPRGYWRGRSWINQIWFAYNGLKNYGFHREARMLAEKTLDIMASGPTCSENYDSSTGEPLGAPDLGWSTLMLTIMKDMYTSALNR